jgi:hypothetical protein
VYRPRNSSGCALLARLTSGCAFLFSLQIFLDNFLICWLMARSNAVIVPTLLHAAFNVVATVHLTATIDLVLTVAIALVALAIAVAGAEPALRMAEPKPTAGPRTATPFDACRCARCIPQGDAVWVSIAIHMRPFA